MRSPLRMTAGVLAVGGGPHGYEAPLWRALTVFRVAAFGFASVLAVARHSHFTRPVLVLCGLTVMALWTGYSSYAYPRDARRSWLLPWADLAITTGCLLLTRWVLRADDLAVTLPMVWIAGPVIAWAIRAGRRAGCAAAAVIGACCMVVRGRIDLTGVNEGVLLLLTAIAIGHIARLSSEAETRALEVATARERERLARGIHDSVLQVLALVQRRGTELGGEAAELGRLAGEQESALRQLIGTRATGSSPGPGPIPGPGPGPGLGPGFGRLLGPRSNSGPGPGFARGRGPGSRSGPAGNTDLREVLSRFATATVTVATPAAAVVLPGAVADELAAAVGAALDNVRRHVGPQAPAWLLVEDEGDGVVVTVRDDGPGIAPGRLAEAARAGRIGVTRSIRGRVEELGGTVAISSPAGQGTEVEMRVPRR
jgi:signal transduction histidine kinase